MMWIDSIVPMFCGQALVTESSSIFVPSGGRKWDTGDFPLSCLPWKFSTDTFVTLPPYHLATLPPYHLATLPPYYLTTLPPYHLTTLPPYHLTTWPPRRKVSVKEKINEFCFPPCFSRWQCVALSYLHPYVIVYDRKILYYYLIYQLLGPSMLWSLSVQLQCEGFSFLAATLKSICYDLC